MINDSANVLRKETFEMENPDVFVETVSSDVKIMASADGKCHVEISANSESAKHLADEVEITSNGRRVSVRVDKKNRGLMGFFGGSSTELFVTVRLPSAGVLRVKTVSGDIEVNQTLLSIEIGSVSGDIAVLQNPTDTCALKTVSGDITAHTFSACQYSLRSVSGDISVHVAPGLEIDVDGKSISGDLESEISLSSTGESPKKDSELVTITTSTVSGDFILART